MIIESWHYVYPIWKNVSFRIIAENHIKHLPKECKIVKVDEYAFPFFFPPPGYRLILHPFFFLYEKYREKYRAKLEKAGSILSIDVADSNRLTTYAVEMANSVDALVVPSHFARKAYIDSGVRVPVHVVPHGVSQEYLELPRVIPSTFKALAEKKDREGCKVLLVYIPHSGYRKGQDLAVEIFHRLRRERKDVLLAVRTCYGVGWLPDNLVWDGSSLHHVGSKGVIKNWFSEMEQMELFDLADIYLHTSRGGGFELPPLLALARGVPAVGARGGAWEDYFPDWGLVDSVESRPVLEGNPIHCGTGVEMVVEKAVDRVCEILDNLEEYRQRVREHVLQVISKNFTWAEAGRKLYQVLQTLASMS